MKDVSSKANCTTVVPGIQPESDSDRRERIATRNRLAQRPLLADLKSVGVSVDSVWSLSRTNPNYGSAIPILLQHIELEYPAIVREGIAKAIGGPGSREIAWEPINTLYLTEPNLPDRAPDGEIGAPSGPKDKLACAISEMAKPDDLPTLIELISDAKNGPSRVFFVTNLVRSKKPIAFETLVRLSKDPDLKIEIEQRLKGKMKREAKVQGRGGAKN
jgi:hypothetical protein